MSKESKGGPSPMGSARGRKTGSHLQPEGASPRFTGPTRGKYPKGTVPSPENIRARFTGSFESNTMKKDVVKPIATREGGGHGKPVGSRSNPFRTSRGGFGKAGPGNGSSSNPL